ncbi:mechanosensitive ion channel family protein [Gaopeijia maritima]|uniref:Mechanosensitive ion channel n=1 Tax=Gaopeijia maritima TaxID=3119007 RepID=A0ABU9ED01_9BACT
METLSAQVTRILEGMWASVLAAIPGIVVAIVIGIVGLVVASVASRILRIVLVRLRFDQLVRRSGIDRWLERAGVQSPVEQVLPRILFYVLLFLFAREGAEALGLTALSEGIAAIIGYLPNLVSAFLIVLVGGALAQVAGGSVAVAARGFGIDFGPALGRLVTGALVFLVAVTALAELQVDTILVRNVAQLILGGICLAAALSLGLGSRDITRNVLAGFYARRTLEVGQEVEVGGRVGVVEALTPTQVHLRSGGRTVILNNAIFLEGPVAPSPESPNPPM